MDSKIHPEQNAPPPAQYNQPTTGHASTVIVGQSIPGVVVGFREVPVRIRCQACGADVLTSTRYETGLMTWIAVGALCVFGCWLGCCFIPFCIDACKDVVHTCPNCKQVVGKYNRA